MDDESKQYERCPHCGQFMFTDSCIDCPHVVILIDPLPILATWEKLYTTGQSLGFNDDAIISEAGKKLEQLSDDAMKAIQDRMGWE